MHWMVTDAMTTRRGFLTALAAASAVPAIGWAEAGAPAWLACARDGNGGFALYGLGAGGSLAFRVLLPARGHAGARHPDRAEAVVMARRPGTYALVIDCATGRGLARLDPPAGLHFNGHAAYLAGGAMLATAEQRADDSTGLVGLWDTATWARIGAWPTGGLGPHEIVALPDGGLAVANGGIATDPTDRRKLNLDTMRPSLVILAADGALRDRVEWPEMAQNSIRHLALRADGTLALALQWEGPRGEVVPLLALRAPDGRVTLADAPDPEVLAMQGYAGSVAWSGNGTQVAITSPRGGRVQVYGADGAFFAAQARPDVCGLAPLPTGFVASCGSGLVLLLTDTGTQALGRHPVAWDNHMVAV
jgi:hypothetical protein